MKIIEPDFDRLLDLPGAEATPSPVDIDRGATGFSDLLSLRVHEFADGAAVEGGTEADEMLAVLLAGAVAIEVTGAHEGGFQLDADGDWAVYLPPQHRYSLSPLTPATVAFVRARPTGGATEPRAFAPVNGILAIAEPCERLRLRLLPLMGETDAAAGLGDGTERLVHLSGPASVRMEGKSHDLPPAHTLALSPGEGALVTGEGELLAVAALRPAAAP